MNQINPTVGLSDMGNMADLPVCYSNGSLSFVGHFYTLTVASDRLTDSGETMQSDGMCKKFVIVAKVLTHMW